MIETKNLERIYTLGNQKVIALSKTSLKINDGEFVAIMGPSGSGKSTLMNILGCLDKPTSGELFLDNKEISNYNDNQLAKIRNQKIGFVFQSFNLLNDLTALDNVAMPLFFARINKNERLERASEALVKVGLANRQNHKPLELSGGQQQRVSVARALVNKPSIILADEPTGALDTKTSYEIISLFKELNDLGSTIVIITHEPDIAQCTKRIILIRDGQIVEDIKNTPKLDSFLKNRKKTGDLL